MEKDTVLIRVKTNTRKTARMIAAQTSEKLFDVVERLVQSEYDRLQAKK